MELDQLYKIHRTAFAERLALLEKYPLLVEARDDLYWKRSRSIIICGNMKKPVS